MRPASRFQRNDSRKVLGLEAQPASALRWHDGLSSLQLCLDEESSCTESLEKTWNHKHSMSDGHSLGTQQAHKINY